MTIKVVGFVVEDGVRQLKPQVGVAAADSSLRATGLKLGYANA
jgi:hypothetical protein